MPIRITRDDLRHRMTNGDHPTLVEALGVGYYTDAHLPGAVNIPPGHVETLAARLLPDRQAPIVVYCTGGGASGDAGRVSPRSAGYAAVAVYLGGKEDWVEHGLPLERLPSTADEVAHSEQAAQGPAQVHARRAAFPTDQHR